MQYIIPEGIYAVDLETSEGFDNAEVYGHGNFQRGVLLFTALSMWVLHCHMLAFPLISADVDHWCRPPEYLNVSTAQWKEWGIPRGADGQHSRCSVYANLLDTNDSRVIPCDEWDYEAEFAPTSIVSHWNLVCGRTWRIVLVNALTMAGALGFLAVAGFLADRTGRKPVALASASLLIISTFGSGFATTYIMYVCMKFLVSGSSSSLFMASSVLLFEVSTNQKRIVQHGLSVAVGLTLGDVSFAVIGQLTHAAWMVRQLLMVAPTGLVPVGYLLLAESPRWLIARRRLKNAESVMHTIARTNGFPASGPLVLVAKMQEKLRFMLSTEERADPSTSVMRRRALISFGATFSIMFAYYALLVAWAARKVTVWAQKISLATNMFAAIAMLPVFNRSSRKSLLITAFTFTGISCSLLSLAICGGQSLWLAHAVILVAAETSCFVTAVFNLVYFTEVFPAPVRGTVVSLSFAFGHLGAVLAAPVSVLRAEGREDLFFALVSALVYGAAWLLYRMPIDISAETTRISSPDSRSSGILRRPTVGPSGGKRELLEEMVKTLERPPSPTMNKTKRRSLAQSTGSVDETWLTRSFRSLKKTYDETSPTGEAQFDRSLRRHSVRSPLAEAHLTRNLRQCNDAMSMPSEFRTERSARKFIGEMSAHRERELERSSRRFSNEVSSPGEAQLAKSFRGHTNATALPDEVRTKRSLSKYKKEIWSPNNATSTRSRKKSSKGK